MGARPLCLHCAINLKSTNISLRNFQEIKSILTVFDKTAFNYGLALV